MVVSVIRIASFLLSQQLAASPLKSLSFSRHNPQNYSVCTNIYTGGFKSLRKNSFFSSQSPLRLIHFDLQHSIFLFLVLVHRTDSWDENLFSQKPILDVINNVSRKQIWGEVWAGNPIGAIFPPRLHRQDGWILLVASGPTLMLLRNKINLINHETLMSSKNTSRHFSHN